jgi:hypothetical protein
MERVYITLARDIETKDDIVFGVRATIPEQARQLIEKFYHEQHWGEPGNITVASFRSNATDPILFVGHAHAEYQKLEDQIVQLCTKLMEQADGADLIEDRDALYAFVEQFEIGKQLIDTKYAPTEQK